VKPVEHRVCGGIFTPDPAIPADVRFVRGKRVVRRVCRCGLLGAPGDAHHDAEPPDGADHGQRAAGEEVDPG
jgi:hypothetical protein